MGNRMSWSMYDKVRKTEGLGKRKSLTDTADSTPKRKKYSPSEHTFDKEKLLEEARSWSGEQQINWSKLAREHGLQKRNGGQILKTYLADMNVYAATKNERPNRENRRAKKKLGGKISFPMHETVAIQKKKLQEKIRGIYSKSDIHIIMFQEVGPIVNPIDLVVSETKIF